MKSFRFGARQRRFKASLCHLLPVGHWLSCLASLCWGDFLSKRGIIMTLGQFSLICGKCLVNARLLPFGGLVNTNAKPGIKRFSDDSVIKKQSWILFHTFFSKASGSIWSEYSGTQVLFTMLLCPLVPCFCHQGQTRSQAWPCPRWPKDKSAWTPTCLRAHHWKADTICVHIPLVRKCSYITTLSCGGRWYMLYIILSF